MQAADATAPAPPSSADQGDTPRFFAYLRFAESSLPDVRLRLDLQPEPGDAARIRNRAAQYRGNAEAELNRVREEFFSTGEGKKVQDIESRVAEAEAAIGKLSIELGQAERDWSAAVASGADASEPAARRRTIKADLADAKDSLVILQPMLAKAEGEARKRYAVLIRQRFDELNKAAGARAAVVRAAIGELISEACVELALACFEATDLGDAMRGLDRRVEKF
jgi:hypothetical protein